MYIIDELRTRTVDKGLLMIKTKLRQGSIGIIIGKSWGGCFLTWCFSIHICLFFSKLTHKCCVIARINSAVEPTFGWLLPFVVIKIF